MALAMIELSTAADVFDKLGGVRPVAEMTGRTYDAAWNWKRFGRFPPNTYSVMTTALASNGCTAPASLWGMVEAAAQ